MKEGIEELVVKILNAAKQEQEYDHADNALRETRGHLAHAQEVISGLTVVCRVMADGIVAGERVCSYIRDGGETSGYEWDNLIGALDKTLVAVRSQTQL